MSLYVRKVTIPRNPTNKENPMNICIPKERRESDYRVALTPAGVKLLVQAGYRVGVIAQPDITSDEDIGRLGEPALFWGVTAGSIDSMVANYTALKKKRKSDDYTPGGINNRRPDRATIVYTNLIRRFSNRTNPTSPARPIVLGGIEASLRRVAHYDFWSDRVRRSLLFDAKADYILYGMAEKAVLELAACLQQDEDPRQVRGLCYISKEPQDNYLELPAYEAVEHDRLAFIDMFHIFYRNNDPMNAKGLFQKHGNRYLVQNPPSFYHTQEELDKVYSLDFERAQHPYYERLGPVKALDTIRFSISTHRGCYGECNFCAIAVHEGRTVRWRSSGSILAEAELLSRHPEFKGYIHDLGGPTANMYGYECEKKLNHGSCPSKRCLYPVICPLIKVNHRPQLELLKQVRKLKGVKKVFVASGIRYDLVLSDTEHGDEYLREIVSQHVNVSTGERHRETLFAGNLEAAGDQADLGGMQRLPFSALEDHGHCDQAVTSPLSNPSRKTATSSTAVTTRVADLAGSSRVKPLAAGVKLSTRARSLLPSKR